MHWDRACLVLTEWSNALLWHNTSYVSIKSMKMHWKLLFLCLFFLRKIFWLMIFESLFLNSFNWNLQVKCIFKCICKVVIGCYAKSKIFKFMINTFWFWKHVFRSWEITTLSLSLEVVHQTLELTLAKRITDTTGMHHQLISGWKIFKSLKNVPTTLILPTVNWLSKLNIALISTMQNSAANHVP